MMNGVKSIPVPVSTWDGVESDKFKCLWSMCGRRGLAALGRTYLCHIDFLSVFYFSSSSTQGPCWAANWASFLNMNYHIEYQKRWAKEFDLVEISGVQLTFRITVYSKTSQFSFATVNSKKKLKTLLAHIVLSIHLTLKALSKK